MMKMTKTIGLILGLIISIQIFGQNTGVSITEDNSPPDNSAMLDIKTNTKGLLIPRMTQTQRNQITNAATGLMIFQTDQIKGFYYWTGSSWLHLTEGVEGMTTNTIPNWNGSNFTNSPISVSGNKIITSDTLKSNQRIKDKTGLIMPVGTVLSYAGSTLPEGWLWCDGSEKNKNTFTDLFAVIGTSWGTGANADYFKLPDLRGEFLRGLDRDNGNGFANRDPDLINRTNISGTVVGNVIGSYQNDAFQGHVHTHMNAMYGTLSGTANWVIVTSSIANLPETDGTNGVPRTSNETRSKNAYVNYIIKY